MQKIPQEEWEKARGQLKLQLNDVLSIFGMYGMKEFIPGAIEEIMEPEIVVGTYRSTYLTVERVSVNRFHGVSHLV